MGSRPQLWLAGVLFLAVWVLSGCGGSSSKTGGTVKGKVTLDGTPVSGGVVAFTSGRSTLKGGIEKDGTYKVANIPPGEAKVAVISSAPAGAPTGGGKAAPIPKTEGMPETGGDSGGTPLPAKYAKPETSGLSTTVKAGENTYDIPLSAK